jgi:hypothetical protein
LFQEVRLPTLVPPPPPLETLFRRRPVVDLDALRRALQTPSRTTVFRALRPLDYLTSYSHGGRYYTLRRLARFDAHGLWWHDDIGFSTHQTLRKTLIHLAETAPAGHTHEELRQIVRLRVHDTLHWLVAEGMLVRRSWQAVSLYLSARPAMGEAQWHQRQALSLTAPLSLTSAQVIDVLVEVLHDPDADPGAIARRLRATGQDVPVDQIAAVFARYDIKKKASGASRRSRRSARKSPR